MAQYTIELAPSAAADMKSIYHYSRITHGVKTAIAYEALIVRALKDIKADPQRLGSRDQSEVAENVRSHHISLAKQTIKSRIKNPRHVIFYFTAEKDKIVVSRVLHDARDHTRFMEDMRRDVTEQAKLSKRPARNKSRKR